MIFKALLLLLDLEIKLKEDDFSKIKASVEAYEAALADFQAQRFDAALAKLRPLVGKPTGAEDRKILVTKYDRQLARQITTGEHEYYPYQLAARCLLSMARGESDKARAKALLKEAKEYLDASINACQAESSKVHLRRVEEAAAKLDEAEPAGPTPEETATKEIRKRIDAGDFVGAAALIEKSKLPALKEDLLKAQKKYLGLKWADAEEYLGKFKPTRKIGALVEELRALLPSKVTAMTPEFIWIQDFADQLYEHRSWGTVENAKRDPAEGFVARALELEQFTLARAAMEVRFEHASGVVRRGVAAAKRDIRASLAEAQETIARAKRERDALDASKDKIASRKPLVERCVEFQSEKIQALEALFAELPKRSEAVDEVLQSLSRCDPEVFGPNANGSYDPLLAKLERAMAAADFAKCHKEVQATAHYLLAALTALEGFRRGDVLSEIKRLIQPPLSKARELVPSFELDLPISPKVKALLR
jgi:hypothetical protein